MSDDNDWMMKSLAAHGGPRDRCLNCNRPLLDDEEDLCPSCEDEVNEEFYS